MLKRLKTLLMWGRPFSARQAASVVLPGLRADHPRLRRLRGRVFCRAEPRAAGGRGLSRHVFPRAAGNGGARRDGDSHGHTDSRNLPHAGRHVHGRRLPHADRLAPLRLRRLRRKRRWWTCRCRRRTRTPSSFPLPTEPPPQESFAELLRYNPDTVGYLSIGEIVDLPVVQRENDNEYYLTHAYSGEEAREGALFLDGANRFERRKSHHLRPQHAQRHHVRGIVLLWRAGVFAEKRRGAL